MRFRLTAGLLAVLSIAAIAATATSAAPGAGSKSFDFTLIRDPGDGSVELGAPQGPETCTGSGSSLTCVQNIGTNTTHTGSAPVRDNGTGRSGTMTVACSVMYAGTQTTYAAHAGRARCIISPRRAEPFFWGALSGPLPCDHR